MTGGCSRFRFQFRFRNSGVSYNATANPPLLLGLGFLPSLGLAVYDVYASGILLAKLKVVDVVVLIILFYFNSIAGIKCRLIEWVGRKGRKGRGGRITTRIVRIDDWL